MRQSEQTINDRISTVSALLGKTSKQDLKVLASAVFQLQYVENKNTAEVLRDIQLFLTSYFMLLLPPDFERRKEAFEMLKVLHAVSKELEWQTKYSLGLMD